MRQTKRRGKMVVLDGNEFVFRMVRPVEPDDAYPDSITCPNCEDVQMPRTPHSCVYRCPVCEHREVR